MTYIEIFILVFAGSGLTGLAMRINWLRIGVETDVKILSQRVETLQKRLDALERKSALPKHDPLKSFLTL
jgi:hypothetical protein